jgi:hypothetical protein
MIDKIEKNGYQENLELTKDPKEYHKHIIRNRTYNKYGPATVCMRCGSCDRVSHHHTTIPYDEDEFIDLCIDCHTEEHRKLKQWTMIKLQVYLKSKGSEDFIQTYENVMKWEIEGENIIIKTRTNDNIRTFFIPTRIVRCIDEPIDKYDITQD